MALFVLAPIRLFSGFELIQKWILYAKCRLNSLTLCGTFN